MFEAVRWVVVAIFLYGNFIDASDEYVPREKQNRTGQHRNGEQEKLSKTILAFVGEDKMRIYAFFEGKRPTIFDNDERILIFKRKK